MPPPVKPRSPTSSADQGQCKIKCRREGCLADSLWRVCTSKQPKSSFWRKSCKLCKFKNQQVTWNQWVEVERIPLPPPNYRFYNQCFSVHFTRYCGEIATRSVARSAQLAVRGRSSVLIRCGFAAAFCPLHQSNPEQNASFYPPPLLSVI